MKSPGNCVQYAVVVGRTSDIFLVYQVSGISGERVTLTKTKGKAALQVKHRKIINPSIAKFPKAHLSLCLDMILEIRNG